jgi:hypothetical protein
VAKWTVSKVLGLALKAAGAVVAALPLIISLDFKNPKNIPKNILYNYTGYSMDSNSLNVAGTAQGIASIGGGVILAKVGSWVSQHKVFG